MKILTAEFVLKVILAAIIAAGGLKMCDLCKVGGCKCKDRECCPACP